MNKGILIILAFLLLGCSEPLDFSQSEDLEVIPTVTSSLIYFESDEATINQAPTPFFFNQDFIFDAFNNDFVNERVLDGIILYQIENNTSKLINLSIQFLDENDTILDTENFEIEANANEVLERGVVYGAEGKSMDILRNTQSFQVIAENLGDNISTTSQNGSLLIFRSSGSFRIQLQ